MSRRTGLELTWIGKEDRPKLERRILMEDPAKSYHAKFRIASADFRKAFTMQVQDSEMQALNRPDWALLW